MTFVCDQMDTGEKKLMFGYGQPLGVFLRCMECPKGYPSFQEHDDNQKV